MIFYVGYNTYFMVDIARVLCRIYHIFYVGYNSCFMWDISRIVMLNIARIFMLEILHVLCGL